MRPGNAVLTLESDSAALATGRRNDRLGKRLKPQFAKPD